MGDTKKDNLQDLPIGNGKVWIATLKNIKEKKLLAPDGIRAISQILASSVVGKKAGEQRPAKHFGYQKKTRLEIEWEFRTSDLISKEWDDGVGGIKKPYSICGGDLEKLLSIADRSSMEDLAAGKGKFETTYDVTQTFILSAIMEKVEYRSEYPLYVGCTMPSTAVKNAYGKIPHLTEEHVKTMSDPTAILATLYPKTYEEDEKLTSTNINTALWITNHANTFYDMCLFYGIDDGEETIKRLTQGLHISMEIHGSNQEFFYYVATNHIMASFVAKYYREVGCSLLNITDDSYVTCYQGNDQDPIFRFDDTAWWKCINSYLVNYVKKKWIPTADLSKETVWIRMAPEEVALAREIELESGEVDLGLDHQEEKEKVKMNIHSNDILAEGKIVIDMEYILRHRENRDPDAFYAERPDIQLCKKYWSVYSAEMIQSEQRVFDEAEELLPTLMKEQTIKENGDRKK